METQFHELEHESKMQLLKTLSHTFERRGYEADKKRQEYGERNEAYPYACMYVWLPGEPLPCP